MLFLLERNGQSAAEPPIKEEGSETKLFILRDTAYFMLRISQQCKDLILGSLLGDSWLPKLKKGRRNAYLGVCHSTKQEEYFNHKFQILKEIGAENVYSKSYLLNGKNITSKEFVTKTNEFLTNLYYKLYIDGKKTVTKEYLSSITDRALAYWIMDDGSLVWHKRKRKEGLIYSTCEFYLATNCFSLQENEIILEWLKEKYNVIGKLRFHKSSNSYYLILNRYEYQKLSIFIKDYIVPSMFYKIDFSKCGNKVVMTSTP